MRRRALWVAACAAGAALGLGCERVVLRFMTPSEPFAGAALPAAPDYDDPAHWSALPERADAADVEAPGFPAGAAAAAAADVFYVHPTSYLGSLWNGPVGDASLDAQTDRGATRIQASAFAACCAVYAPRYRQANGTAFTHPSPDGDRALDVAYGDVRAAFRRFLARRDPARPFALAAHSQGSVLAYRLLRDEIAGTPLAEQLVAAWLVGVPLTLEAIARDLPGIPPCSAPDETGCLAGWNARGPGHVPGTFEIVAASGTPLCVNPLSWRRDEAALPASANAAAVFLDAEPPLVAPGFASARCRDGRLEVELTGRPPRDLPSRILDALLGPENFHPIEYQLFWADLRTNASTRLRAWQLRHEGDVPFSSLPPSQGTSCASAS